MSNQAIPEHYTIKRRFKIKEYSEEVGLCGSCRDGEN